MEAIAIGRFNKDTFKLKYSILIGEDGGLY